jgi:hypothetical protein
MYYNIHILSGWVLGMGIQIYLVLKYPKFSLELLNFQKYSNELINNSPSFLEHLHWCSVCDLCKNIFLHPRLVIYFLFQPHP